MFMLLMLVMATVNMIMLKFQGMQRAPMSAGGSPEPFNQPLLQAGLMMVGESICLPFYFFSRRLPEQTELISKRAPSWVFVVPCCCDLTATALVCAGLAYIAVSLAQMCRSTVIIFTCILSWFVLGRRQQNYHLAGVAFVFVGIVIVACSAMLGNNVGLASSHMFQGIVLCIIAQVFQSSMFVYEEKIMSQYTVQPLEVVGKEGIWGIGIALLLLCTGNALGLTNTYGALYQISSSTALMYSVFGSMLAVAAFNFAGATVTQKASAVARTTIKISSTILIWIVELSVGWNTFNRLQLFGFVLVATGTLMYNRIIVAPCLERVPEELDKSKI